MSIYASIGPDVKCYQDGYGGDNFAPDEWIDVAVSCLSPRVRLLVCGEEGDSEVILGPEGVQKLIITLNHALVKMNE